MVSGNANERPEGMVRKVGAGKVRDIPRLITEFINPNKYK
ncbi:hypothetical protein Pan5_03 [Pseudanabaena phage Pan5]|nr:hypothetical protein Pan5_03 [Pseudanabaena phage Pan5]